MLITGQQIAERQEEESLTHIQAKNMWMNGILSEVDPLIIAAKKIVKGQIADGINRLMGAKPGESRRHYEDLLFDEQPALEEALIAVQRLDRTTTTIRAFARFDTFKDEEFSITPDVEDTSPRRFDPDRNKSNSTDGIEIEYIGQAIEGFRAAFPTLPGIELLDRLEPIQYSRTTEDKSFTPGKPPFRFYLNHFSNLRDVLTNTHHMWRELGQDASPLYKYLIDVYAEWEKKGLPEGAPTKADLSEALNSIMDLAAKTETVTPRQVAEFAGNPDDLAAAGLGDDKIDLKKLELFLTKVPTKSLPPGLVLLKCAAAAILSEKEKPNTLLMHEFFAIARSASKGLATSVAEHSPTIQITSVVGRYINQGKEFK